MNTKRSTTTVRKVRATLKHHNIALTMKVPAEENKPLTQREKLISLLMKVSDREALEVFQELARQEGKGLEDVIYPEAFLDMMLDTMTKTLMEQLEQCGAPKETLELLEDLTIFNVWMVEVHKSGGRVQGRVNRFLMDTIANASRNIVAVGGVFHTPYGETKRREVIA